MAALSPVHLWLGTSVGDFILDFRATEVEQTPHYDRSHRPFRKYVFVQNGHSAFSSMLPVAPAVPPVNTRCGNGSGPRGILALGTPQTPAQLSAPVRPRGTFAGLSAGRRTAPGEGAAQHLHDRNTTEFELRNLVVNGADPHTLTRITPRGRQMVWEAGYRSESGPHHHSIAELEYWR